MENLKEKLYANTYRSTNRLCICGIEHFNGFVCIYECFVMVILRCIYVYCIHYKKKNVCWLFLYTYIYRILFSNPNRYQIYIKEYYGCCV